MLSPKNKRNRLLFALSNTGLDVNVILRGKNWKNFLIPSTLLYKYFWGCFCGILWDKNMKLVRCLEPQYPEIAFSCMGWKFRKSQQCIIHFGYHNLWKCPLYARRNAVNKRIRGAGSTRARKTFRWHLSHRFLQPRRERKAFGGCVSHKGQNNRHHEEAFKCQNRIFHANGALLGR